MSGPRARPPERPERPERPGRPAAGGPAPRGRAPRAALPREQAGRGRALGVAAGAVATLVALGGVWTLATRTDAPAAVAATGTGGSSGATPAPTPGPGGGGAPPAVGSVPAPDAATCPRDGRWHVCSVRERLRNAGLAAVPGADSVRLPFLSVAGARWTVGRAELQLFLYDDPAAAEREALAVDPIRVAPRGGSVAWPRPATFVHSGNLIAVVLSENGRLTERLQLALEAGPPQPERAVELPPAGPTPTAR